jgi:RNase P/RNase MRP subunit p30
MDIRDLMAAIAGTNNVALRITYENLLEASKNHLRTFVRQLRRQGTDYDGPHFIDPVLYEAILGL